MNENLLVYLGTSIGHARARFLLPSAQYHPPLQAGDFEKLLILPKVILVLDGYYSEALEDQVVNLLDAGVKIYGASGLGAFLAAKLKSSGMLGVGSIYQRFAEGVYQGESVLRCQVLVQGRRYRRVTEPLINIYATMDHALSGNALNASMVDIMISAAEALPDDERTFANIFLQAEEAGIDKHVLREFSAWVSHGGYVDQQRHDACMLLNRIAYQMQADTLFGGQLCDQGEGVLI